MSNSAADGARKRWSRSGETEDNKSDKKPQQVVLLKNEKLS